MRVLTTLRTPGAKLTTRHSKLKWALLACILVLTAAITGGVASPEAQARSTVEDHDSEAMVDHDSGSAGDNNRAPRARDDRFTTAEDRKLTLRAPGVLKNDTDADGDRLSAVRISSPRHGSLNFNANGSFTYTPDKNYFGPDSFTYKAKDAKATSNRATVSIIVAAVNDAPGFTKGADQSADEDSGAQSVTGWASAIKAGPANESGQRVAFEVTSNTTPSLFSRGPAVSPDGTLAYTPATDASGEATIRVRLKDGGGTARGGTDVSPEQEFKITIGALNDAPVVRTSGGTTTFTENGSAVKVDDLLTVTDTDSAQLTGATVSITSNHQSADELTFADAGPIHGSYNSASGILTLTGTDSVANYQAALRSIQFRNTSEDPNGSARTISFRVNDGSATDNLSDVVTQNVNVSPVNDPPVVRTSSGSAAYTEDGPPTVVDPRLTITDVDDARLHNATVQVGGVGEPADRLDFTDQDGIRGTYDASRRVLMLAGSASLADYQAALRSVTFRTTSDTPSTATREVEFAVGDGADFSELGSLSMRSVSVAASNDAPTLTTSAGDLPYTEGDAAKVIDGSLTLTDPDTTNLAGATVSISDGFRSGDDLIFDDTANITGSYNSGTGALALTGTDTVANYQAALRSVQYRSTSNTPGTSREITFQVDDGQAANNLSNAATKNVDITEVNSAPVVTLSGGTATYTEGGSAISVDDALTVSDTDSLNLAGATVKFTSGFQSGDELVFANQNGISGVYTAATGELALSGESSVANYQTALRSIQFTTTNDEPVVSKVITYQVDDGQSVDNLSNTPTRTIDLTPTNDAPTVTNSSGTASFTENGSAVIVDPDVTVGDVDDTNLETASVQITGGYQNGKDTLRFVNQDGITHSFSAASGTLQLTGTATEAQWEGALRSVEFESTSDDPGASRTVEFIVNDGSDASGPDSRGISITQINDAPHLTQQSGTASFVEDAGAVAISDAIGLSDAESNSISGATVSITNNFASGQDELLFADTANIRGSYNSNTGVLTLSGPDTVANYQAALRSVQYRNTSDNPDTQTRTISFHVTDNGGTANGGNDSSNTVTRDITVTPANDAPTLAASGFTPSFTEDGSATAIDTGFTVTDPDSANMASATLELATGTYQNGSDVLSFTNTPQISGTWDAASRTLTLTGDATKADWESALRSVTFSTTSQNPGTSRTVALTINDGSANSSPATNKSITVVPVNDAPTLTTSGGTLSYTENDAAKDIDTGLTIADVDSTNAISATVRISGNYENGKDILSFTNTPQISGTFNATTGTMTLSGTTTLANYQTALRSVKYHNTSDDPSTSARTVTFKVRDADGTANGGIDTSTDSTRNITVTPVNDAPVAVADSKGDALANTRFVVGTTTTGPHLSLSGDVISNDTDVDTPQENLSATAGSSKSTQIASCGACPNNVSMESDGQFTYDPPQGFTGEDTFSYTVEDNDTGDGDGEKTHTGTVTVTVVGPLVWYVEGDASAPAAGAGGRSHTPFNSLADLRTGGSADAKDGSGDYIFVYDAASSYAGGIDLETNQKLIGEPHSLDVDPNGATLLQSDIVPAGGSNPVIVNNSGNGITLGSGNTIRSLSVGNSSGSGISGTSFGTLDVANASINSTGQALNLSTGTLAGNGFSSISSSGGTNNILLNSVQTSRTADLGSGALSGATQESVKISGQNGSFSYSGAIANTTGTLAASITGKTGGTVTLSGKINDATAGKGISVSNNSAGTITFSGNSKKFAGSSGTLVDLSFPNASTAAVEFTNGGLDVTGTAGAVGFKAAGVDGNDGTVKVQGSNNVLSTATGRALDVQNVTIGAPAPGEGGLNFKSISANGAPNGIVLNNTGASGGLTVTGTTDPLSGGTIRNTTSHAILLADTRDVDLRKLQVEGPDHAGVKGTRVTNFSYTDGALSGVGDSKTDADDAAFAFNTLGANNVDGRVTITGNAVTNPYGGGVQIRNASGTIADADISSNAFQSSTDPAASKQDGVEVTIEGTATTAAALTKGTISANKIINFPSGGGVELVGAQITSRTAPRVTFGNPGSPTDKVVVSGNEIRGDATNKMGTGGIAASVSGMADGQVEITRNGTDAVPLQNMMGEAIGVGAGGTADAKFVVTDNVVAPGNVLGNVGISANANRRSVGGEILATPTVDATIARNTVSNTSGAGIKVVHFNSNGTLNAKVVDNAVSAPLQGNPGISVHNGSSDDATYNPTLCAQISGNAASGSANLFGTTHAGIELWKLRDGASTYRFGIHGLTPSPATPAQTETYGANQNPASSPGTGPYAGKKVAVRDGDTFSACTIGF